MHAPLTIIESTRAGIIPDCLHRDRHRGRREKQVKAFGLQINSFCLSLHSVRFGTHGFIA